MLAFSAWLATAIVGLLLLEQIFRNSNDVERWSIKYLCIGLGVLFAYDFFMYSEALLFKQLDPALWQARGLVIALAGIFLAIAIGRGERPPLPRLGVGREVNTLSTALESMREALEGRRFAERYIQTVVSWARAMVLHAALHWPDQADLALWPFALNHAVYLWNNIKNY